MSTETGFPRVLFVTPLAFNHFTGGGVTFSNLFRGWPKDRLFTVHSDQLTLTTDVCTNYFALGPKELPLAWPFELLRRRAGRARMASIAGVVSTGPSAALRPGLLRRVLFKCSEFVFGRSGLPTKAHVSTELAAWIDKAKPQVVYTILGSMEMMELVHKIGKMFNLPVVVHLMDDWRAERERHGLLSPLRRRRLNRLFDSAMLSASGHLAICDDMAAAYGKEFGVQFASIQNVIDTDQWIALAKPRTAAATPARLLYAGSLYDNVQLSSLLEIAASVARLRALGMAISLEVMCPDFMIAPRRCRFEALEGTRVINQVPRDMYFEAVCRADVLLLPVNFSASAVRMIRYSMPTKVPEYLVSGVPVLLYGPRGIAQIEYARRENWGRTVTQRNPQVLDAAIRAIVTDNSLRRDLVERAQAVAAARHDAVKVRDMFRSALDRASKRAVNSDQYSEPA